MCWGGMCYNMVVPELPVAMSIPSLAERVAQVWADLVITAGPGAGPLLALMDELVTTLSYSKWRFGNCGSRTRLVAATQPPQRPAPLAVQPPTAASTPQTLAGPPARGLARPFQPHAAGRAQGSGGLDGGLLADTLWSISGCLRFLTDPTISFSNNLVKQAVRMMRLHMKILDCFRTAEGTQTFHQLA